VADNFFSDFAAAEPKPQGGNFFADFTSSADGNAAPTKAAPSTPAQPAPITAVAASKAAAPSAPASNIDRGVQAASMVDPVNTGLGEVALNVGSGMVAPVAGGLAGLGTLAGNALGLTDKSAADVSQNVTQALTYQPRTPVGQLGSAAIAYPFEKLAEAGRYAGEHVEDATGSPLAATAVDTAVNALPLLLGRGKPAGRIPADVIKPEQLDAWMRDNPEPASIGTSPAGPKPTPAGTAVVPQGAPVTDTEFSQSGAGAGARALAAAQVEQPTAPSTTDNFFSDFAPSSSAAKATDTGIAPIAPAGADQQQPAPARTLETVQPSQRSNFFADASGEVPRPQQTRDTSPILQNPRDAAIMAQRESPSGSIGAAVALLPTNAEMTQQGAAWKSLQPLSTSGESGQTQDFVQGQDTVALQQYNDRQTQIDALNAKRRTQGLTLDEHNQLHDLHDQQEMVGAQTTASPFGNDLSLGAEPNASPQGAAPDPVSSPPSNLFSDFATDQIPTADTGASSLFQIEPVDSKSVAVHGDPDAIRTALADAGFKNPGWIDSGGALRFDASDRDQIEQALGARQTAATTSSVTPAAAVGDTVPQFSRRSGDAQEATNGVPQGLPAVADVNSERLSQAITRYINQDRPVEQQQRVAFQSIRTASLPHDLAGAIGAFEQATGTKINVVRNLTPRVEKFNAVTLGDKVLHVDETAQHPIVLAAAHEWGHVLENTHPELHAELVREVERQGRLPDWMAEMRRRGYQNAGHEAAVRELTNDAIGDAFADPDFLNKVADRNPGVFRRVADAFIKFLDGFLGKFRNLGSNRYLRDVQAFRDRLADVLEKYRPKFSEVQSAGVAKDWLDEPSTLKHAAMTWQKYGTESPYFKTWFGESKVRNSSSRPAVVHHGTGDDFTIFDSKRAGQSGEHATAPLGHFFTEDRGLAQRYAENASDGRPADERVIDAYLSIKNPYTMPLREAQAIDSPAHARAIRAELERRGYDGIRIPEAKSWIAFQSDQVKSTGNRGTFDAQNPDIRFARQNEATEDELHAAYGDAERAKFSDVFTARKEGTQTVVMHNGKEVARIDGAVTRTSLTAAIRARINQQRSDAGASPLPPRRPGEKADIYLRRIANGADAIREATSTKALQKSIGRHAIREMLAKRQRAMDVADATFSEFRKVFDKTDPRINLANVDDWETGKPIRDLQFGAFLGRMTEGFNERIEALHAVDTGALPNLIRYYMPHLYKDPVRASKWFADFLGKAPLAGDKSFMKQRSWPTLKQAMASGLEPITTNPVDWVLAKYASMDKYTSMLGLRNDFEKRGWIARVPSGEPVPSGFVLVDDPAFRSQHTFVVKGENGAPDGAATKYWNWALPETIARDLNNYLKPGLGQYGVWRALRGIENTMVAADLGFSGFHATFTSTDNVIMHLDVAMRRAAIGDSRGAAATLVKALTSVVTSPFEGNKLNQQWRGIRKADANTAAILDALERGGARWKMSASDYQNAIPKVARWLRQMQGEGIAAQLKDKSIAQIAVGAIKVPLTALQAVAEAGSYLIHHWLVPNQKMSARVLLYKYELDRLAGKVGQTRGNYAGILDAMHPDVVRQIAAQVNDVVDFRLGQMTYDNRFWNRMVQDVAQVAVMAPGWQYGMAQTVLGAGKAVKDLVSPTRFVAPLDKAGNVSDVTDAHMGRVGNNLSYFLTLALTLGGGMALLQYLLTGQWPQQTKDYFFPKTGRKNDDDSDERLQFPNYWVDHYKMATEPTRTMENKIHPFWKMVWELGHNKDYFGTQIHNPDDSAKEQVKEVAEYIASKFVPISFGNFTKGQEHKDSALMQVGHFFGINNPPISVTRSPFQAFVLGGGSKGWPDFAKTPEDAHRKQLMHAASAALRRGDEPDYGDLDNDDIGNAQADSEVPLPELLFKKLSYVDRFKGYDMATPDERNYYELRDMFPDDKHLRKSVPFRRLPAAEQQRLRQRLQEITAAK
jgi:hypothetical protein